MKPKHHFLLHYPSIMRKIGPLWNICCLRFESKNREGKQIAHPAICRVNICKTIAIRHQLMMNYRFICKNSEYPPYTVNHVKNISTQNVPQIGKFVHLWPKNLSEYCYSTNYLEYHNIAIKKDTVIVPFSELQDPQFHFVHFIILIDKDTFLLITKSMADCHFNHHLRVYKMHGTEFHWEILTKNDIDTASSSYYNKLADGNFYIAKNWMWYCCIEIISFKKFLC